MCEYEWYYTGLHFPEMVQGDPSIVCLVFARSHLPASDTSDAPFPFLLYFYFSSLTANGVLVLVCDPVPVRSTTLCRVVLHTIAYHE